jgi:methionyl-tRNA formyltransferase
MRIAILCNDRIALPALDQLLATGLVVAVGVPQRNHEIRLLIEQPCARAKVPIQGFHKRTIDTDLFLWLTRYRPDVVLVKTFPFLIPAEAIRMPRFGFINFHYAPLPEWRGANPLFWMIRNQATAGAVTVHEMNEAFDAGPVLLQQPVPLTPDVNFGLFYTQLAYAGVHVSGMLLNGLLTGALQKTEQDHTRAGWYAKPTPADLLINWATMDAAEVNALVNACNPWNKGAVTRWNDWMFGISHAAVINQTGGEKLPGTVISINAGEGFTIACKDGKAIKAEVVYCEEGFYPGHKLAAFGLQKGHQLT